MAQPYYIAEWAAFVCSFFIFFRKTDKYLRWFMPYCFIIVLTETLGFIFRSKGNNYIFNIYMFFDMGFQYWLFYKAFEQTRIKKVVAIVGLTGLSFHVINISFIQGLFKFDSYTVLYEFITLAAISFTYLFFLSENLGKRRFYTDTMFWVSIGMFLYFLPASIVYASFEVFTYHSLEASYLFAKVFHLVNNVCNVICYSFFSIGFLFSMKRGN